MSDTYLDRSISDYFRLLFKENRWGNDESVSGSGSALASPSVRDAVKFLDHVVRQYNIKSIVDVPCGDFYWIPIVLGRFPFLSYKGFDIVDDLIAWNIGRYPYYSFEVANAADRVLPHSDLIFCKDLFLHLRHSDISNILRNFKLSGSRYLVCSSNFGSSNVEISIDEEGACRDVNLLAEPFSLPTPIIHNGYLCMWSLDAIDIAIFDGIVERLNRL